MENKKGLITQEQARELADKYLLYHNKIALKDNISVTRSVRGRGWQIVAKTTPIIAGMETVVTSFPIDMVTGEVGAAIDITVPTKYILKEINERKDINEQKKEQLRTKFGELTVDKNKMNNLKKWFENNAPYLKSIIDLINTILSKL